MDGSGIIDDLQRRGLVHDATDLERLRTRLDEGPITVYAGFDPTASSLHIGNLVPLLLLRRFQLFGHRPVALAGGATGMIGDPSGRSDERNLLDSAALDANIAGIRPQLASLLEFDTPANPARLVDNREWTEPVSVLEFLREVGKHVTVNQMLAKESVKARVSSDQGLSFTEFSYMLLQANDYWWLHENLECELQVGGSDQWGNITAGIDLIRRKSGAHVHGLTVPLVTRADGQKFGKTAAGAVWLDPGRTSPYEFFQYFMNVDDRDVERLLLQLTLLDVDEVDAVITAHRAAADQRDAQRRLAFEVTTLVHGNSLAEHARDASAGFRATVDELGPDALAALADEIPTHHVDRSVVGLDLAELVADLGIERSRSAARRTIEGGGLSLNDVKVQPGQVLTEEDVRHGSYVLLRVGKKRRFLLVVAAT